MVTNKTRNITRHRQFHGDITGISQRSQDFIGISWDNQPQYGGGREHNLESGCIQLGPKNEEPLWSYQIYQWFFPYPGHTFRVYLREMESKASKPSFGLQHGSGNGEWQQSPSQIAGDENVCIAVVGTICNRLEMVGDFDDGCRSHIFWKSQWWNMVKPKETMILLGFSSLLEGRSDQNTRIGFFHKNLGLYRQNDHPPNIKDGSIQKTVPAIHKETL